MRVLMLSTVLAFGLGLAVTTNSHAAGIGSGLNEAANSTSAVTDVQWRRCRTVRTCRVGPWGRRCRVERICRGRGW